MIQIRLVCDYRRVNGAGRHDIACSGSATFKTDAIEDALRQAERAQWKITRPTAGRTAEHLCPAHNPGRIPPSAMARKPSGGGRG